MTDAATASDESAALYVGWEELRRRVAPGVGRDRFKALIKIKQDRSGFPGFREDWGGFYWPRVKQWLDSDNAVGTDVAVATVEDGPENFNAPPRKKARVQARPPRPAVLDREAGGTRSDGVSRHLHSVASGGER